MYKTVETRVIAMPGNTDESGFYFKDIRIERWVEGHDDCPSSIYVVRVPYYQGDVLVRQISGAPLTYWVDSCLYEYMKKDNTFEEILLIESKELHDGENYNYVEAMYRKTTQELNDMINELACWYK